MRSWTLIGVLGIVACGGSSQRSANSAASVAPASAAGGNPCGATANPCGGSNPCGGTHTTTGAAQSWDHFADYATWTRMNHEPFVSQGHQRGRFIVNSYANTPEAAAAFRAQRGPAPVGAIFVKEQFDIVNGQPGPHPVTFTIMVKRDPGFDPEHGDWEWMVADASGRVTMSGRALPMCLTCHEGSHSRDYFFGETHGH